MVKKILSLLSVAGVLFLFSCGGSGSKSADKSADSTAKVAALNINEADWVVTDLGKTSEMIPVSVKLPKDVKLEKNGNGGVDIRLNDWYMITVSANISSDLKSAIDGDKSITVNHQSYQDGKLIIDEPCGFVYTRTMKPESNGTKYEPESNFAFYAEKDGAIFTFLSTRPMDNFTVQGSAYTEDIAQKIYKIIKASAKIN
jgi:hypothetical protein